MLSAPLKKGKRIQDVDWRQARTAVRNAMQFESIAAGEAMVARFIDQLLPLMEKVRNAAEFPQLTADLSPIVWTIVWANREGGLSFPLDPEHNFKTVAEVLQWRFSLPPESDARSVDQDVLRALSANGGGRDPSDTDVLARLWEVCDGEKVPRLDEAEVQRLGWAAHGGGAFCVNHPPGCRCGAQPPPFGGGGFGGGGAMPLPPQATTFSFPNGATTAVVVLPGGPGMPDFPAQPYPPPGGGGGGGPGGGMGGV